MIATLETSKRLKDAGFTQPTPSVNQFWYGLIQKTEEPILLLHKSAKDKWVSDNYQNQHSLESFENWGIFSPSATDILVELQKKTSKGFYWCLTPPLSRDGLWVCASYYLSEGKINEFVSECPADCCAQAYLSITS